VSAPIRRPALPPSVTIVLSLEAAPRVITDAQTDAEANRLGDWILAQPDLVELLDKALVSRERRLRQQERQT
jgi:hypothetical protein